MESILQISYNDLISWITLTLATVIILSVLYRFATKNTNSSDYSETKEPEINTPQNFIFISADIEEASSLLKSAHSDYEKNNFKETIKKTRRAILIVLSQLLKYFDIQNEEDNVENMFQMLHKKGVILPFPQNDIIRLDKIFNRTNEGKLLTKEEIQWVFHISNHIIENAKEVRIEE